MGKIKIWIDEAWRWPWLWSVVACALCFDSDNLPNKKFLDEINDSKKLTHKKREKLYKKLIELSLPFPKGIPEVGGIKKSRPQVFFGVW